MIRTNPPDTATPHVVQTRDQSRRHFRAALAAGLLAILAALPAFGAESDDQTKDWEVELTPYLVLPLSGSADATVNGAEGDDDGSSIGLANGDLDMMFITRAELWWKRVGFIFDGRYINADFDIDLFADNTLLQAIGVNTPLLHSEAQAGILDFFFSYRLLDLNLIPGSKSLRLQAEPFLGARWDIFDIQFTAPNGRTFGSDVNTWAELAVGANVELWLTRGLSVAVRGDASGFGFGQASDISWKTTGLIGYRFPKVFGVSLGYQVFEIDKEFTAQGDVIQYDLLLHGPVIGMTFFY